MSILEIENLTIEFDTASGPFRALDGVDYRVESGEVLAIVGESGSGKSIAMLSIMGLLPNTATVFADKMKFENIDLRSLSNEQRRKVIGKDIAMIFQEPIASLNPCFTIGFQLTETLKTHLNLSRVERRERAIELLQSVGISDAKRQFSSFPHQLSGGQCQRVMIAMAISCSPKLLIADEPTTALDVTIQKQILDLLLEIQNKSDMGLMLK